MRLLVLLFAGCGFANSADEVNAGDDEPMMPEPCTRTLSAQLDTCALEYGASLELSGTLEFSTLTGMLVDKSTGKTINISTQTLATKEEPVQAILAESIVLAPNTKLRAIGPRGFALLSNGEITLGANAVIDVSDNGAGAHTVACDNGPVKGQDDTGGAAGGGGAGFGGAGGRGGDGNSDDIIGDTSDGGLGGAAMTAAPLGPRGGCPGAPGGDGNEVGGNGGRGGGAVWIVAANLEIATGAGINAGGSGGGGGIRTASQGDAGGGGGGSGGVIWIEAPRVRSTGILAANGGGGGEGSGGDNSGAMGAPGQFGAARADGGDGASSSGAGGGAGGYRDAPAQQAAAPDRGGGGGGGGGVGFIRVLSPDRAIAMTSPST